MEVRQILLRSDTAANWLSVDPILGAGEIGTESDTGRFKIGDGSTAWSVLGYGRVDLLLSRTATTVTVGATGDDAVLPAATGSLAGVMSAADKTKLDAITTLGDVTSGGDNVFTGQNSFYNASGQVFGTAAIAEDGVVVAGRAGGTASYRVTLRPAALDGNHELTLPSRSGTVITSADSGTITSAMIADGAIVDGDINAAAAIADSKLATISSSGKVANSATTATSANTASAIVTRDASGNFSAGTITAALSGNAATASAFNGTRTFSVTGDVTGSVASTFSGNVSLALELATGAIVNADINASAGIVDTKLATIATADKVSLSALNIDGGTDIGAALADTDLIIVDDGGGGTNRKAAVTRISDYTFAKVSGDLTITSAGVAAIGSGVVVDADINASAAIAHTKLANITAGRVLLGNASNVPTATALSGDVTINSSGVTAISSGVVVDADINASAAIAHSKLANITAGSVLLGNASNVPTATALTGDVTVSSSGVTAITAGVVVNADVNVSAAIAGTKISPDFGSQAVTTTGTITGASLIPTSATVPTNGVYLPAANTVGIATGGGLAMLLDSSNRLVKGHTTSLNTVNLGGSTITPGIQQHAVDQSNVSIGLTNWQNSGTAAHLVLGKSRSGVVGTHAVLPANDIAGVINFAGSDGTTFGSLAHIRVDADALTSAGSTPGRMTFSTSAPGSTSPTERMRIRSDGNIGIGGSGSGSVTLYNQGSITGFTTAYGNFTNATVQSDVTANAYGYRTTLTTAAAAFNLVYLHHYNATQAASFGAGSTVSNQFGFIADSTLTGAGNNYGFYGNIPSGSGRWNFYANGTAANYFNGDTGIGTTSITEKLTVSGNIGLTGSVNFLTTSPASISANSIGDITISADSSNASVGSQINFVVDGTEICHIAAANGTFAFNKAGNANAGICAQSDDSITNIAGGSNPLNSGLNIGLSGPSRVSDTGYLMRWNTNILYQWDKTNDIHIWHTGTGNERMRLNASGYIGIGATNPSPANGLIRIAQPHTGATGVAGINNVSTIQSDVTVEANLYQSQPNTQAASFTLASLNHFRAIQGSFGAGSTVASQIGFLAAANLVGATNNYGFFGNIPSGTGRWNFYANGTAANYFAGDVRIGSAADTGNLLYVAGSARFNGQVETVNVDNAGAPGFTWDSDENTGFFRPAGDTIGVSTGGTERLRIRSNGNIAIGGTGAATVTVYNQGTITGGTTAYANFTVSAVQSDVTAAAYGYATQLTTASATFTLGNLQHFLATGQTKGAGSTINTQIGFHANANLTQATDNYGFYGNLSTTVGRWNFYANGTAPNYFAGDVRTNTVLTSRKSPVNNNASATLTTTALLDGLCTGTPTANINFTLPTGTNMDAAFQDLQTNQAFEWSVINLAAATHSITVVQGTGHTVVGNMVVPANSSGRFNTRKTAANTFITYRIG